MGDHLVMFMDQLLTESALDSSVSSKTSLQPPVLSPGRDITISFGKIDFDSGSSPSNLGECRICHDEDAESNMETPCSCSGSLKYAHRKCIQRWCNEKGDTICEICHQEFKPGYTSPPPLFIYGGMPLNFRGNWESSRSDLHNPQFLEMLATDGDDFDSDSDEYFPPPSPTSLICCRIVAVIFIILLVLRHVVPVVLSEAGEYSLTLFTLLILWTVGILLPVCFVFRTFIAICGRRTHQDSWDALVAGSTSDEENDLPHTRSRVVRVQ